MDVAERVGQQVQVAVLEHADAAEVGCGDDRRARRRELHGRRRRAVGAIDERLRHGVMMPAPPRPVSPRHIRERRRASQRRDTRVRDSGLQGGIAGP